MSWAKRKRDGLLNTDNFRGAGSRGYAALKGCRWLDNATVFEVFATVQSGERSKAEGGATLHAAATVTAVAAFLAAASIREKITVVLTAIAAGTPTAFIHDKHVLVNGFYGTLNVAAL